MLKHLSVKNFKSWKDLNILFGNVTGLFGTNSSGKSSLLQFLLLLKQTKNATDRGLVLDFGGPEQYINLGSFQDVVFKHDTQQVIQWYLEWSLPKKRTINDPLGKRTDVLASDNDLAMWSEAYLKNKQVFCTYLEYVFGDYSFFMRPKKKGSTEFELIAEADDEQEKFRFKRVKARAWSLPGPVKTHLFPDQAKTYFQNSEFLSLFETEYEALMDNLYYLGPLREPPKRDYSWSGASPLDVGKKGELTVAALLSATIRNEVRNLGGRTHYKSFQEMIAYWLKELGLIHDFEISEIGEGSNLYRAYVKKDKYSAPALLTDVGFGVSQVLPALVLLYYVPEGSIVIMEQPEIHLHPSVQSRFADLILTVSKTRKLQIILESHSEHILRRLQRRVAEQAAESQDIKLFFCDQARGESTISELELTEFGDIKNWPDNFFGDEMGEISATRTAALKRKIALAKK
ncbi:AAA family ATPase [Pseudomonas chlororaphis]|uniref:DUF3696 domain-containing protein n=1 Tax=Pseudomonas chlororaphis TaxID=587753 RepID=A0A0D5XWX1_9PSED|nr:DUF3696 domain-containing protein [Pseudomonas chlororaphis]AKA23601.1 hypothetical protein PCL1606_21480 [Pseudomonas chlororaphis]